VDIEQVVETLERRFFLTMPLAVPAECECCECADDFVHSGRRADHVFINSKLQRLQLSPQNVRVQQVRQVCRYHGEALRSKYGRDSELIPLPAYLEARAAMKVKRALQQAQANG
jgi:hypothetical protein